MKALFRDHPINQVKLVFKEGWSLFRLVFQQGIHDSCDLTAFPVFTLLSRFSLCSQFFSETGSTLENRDGLLDRAPDS